MHPYRRFDCDVHSRRRVAHWEQLERLVIQSTGWPNLLRATMPAAWLESLARVKTVADIPRHERMDV